MIQKVKPRRDQKLCNLETTSDEMPTKNGGFNASLSSNGDHELLRRSPERKKHRHAAAPETRDSRRHKRCLEPPCPFFPLFSGKAKRALGPTEVRPNRRGHQGKGTPRALSSSPLPTTTRRHDSCSKRHWGLPGLKPVHLLASHAALATDGGRLKDSRRPKTASRAVV